MPEPANDANLPDFAKAYLNLGATPETAEVEQEAEATELQPIYLLCQADRRGLFESLVSSWNSANDEVDGDGRSESLAKLTADLRYLPDLDDLQRACEAQPPLAVFVDSVTSARLGPRQMAPMFVRRDRWPVLRVVPRKGMAIVFSLHPPLRTTFRDALRKLHEQGADWLFMSPEEDEADGGDRA